MNEVSRTTYRHHWFPIMLMLCSINISCTKPTDSSSDTSVTALSDVSQDITVPDVDELCPGNSGGGTQPDAAVVVGYGNMTGLQAGSPWPMDGYSPTHQRRSPSNGPHNPKLKWTVQVGKHVIANPIIAKDGTVYVGAANLALAATASSLSAINPDGTKKWSFATGNDIWGTAAIAADGTIYFGSMDKNVYALNSDGTLKWKFTTDAIAGVPSSPAIAPDGTIYVGSYVTRFYALNPDGTEKWHFQDPDFGGFKAAPAIGTDGTVYIGSSRPNFYAFAPDGTKKWVFTAAMEFRNSSPAVGIDGSIYVGNMAGRVFALAPTGAKLWEVASPEPFAAWVIASPAIAADGTVYVGVSRYTSAAGGPSGQAGRLLALNGCGLEKWRFDLAGPFESSPTIGADGLIYFGGLDKNLYALNPDGSKKWTMTLGASISSSPAIASDGTLYVGAYDGKLYALND